MADIDRRFCDIEKQLVALEERMNTQQAKYEGAIDRLRADMAKRDKSNLWQQIVLTGIAVGIMGTLFALFM